MHTFATTLTFALVAWYTRGVAGEAYTYPVKSINIGSAPTVSWYEGFSPGQINESISLDDMHPVHGTQTADGGYVLVGKGIESETNPASEAFAVKLDARGAFVWLWRSKAKGPDAANAVAQLPASLGGALLVAGYRTGTDKVARRSVTALDPATGAERWTATNFGDAKNSHGAFEMVGLGTDADGGAPFVLLSGVRARPAADEMWFKSYGNVPNGRAFVSRFPASAFASTGVPPTAAAAAWTVGFDDGAADNAARYATAKAARAPASLNGRVAVLLWGEGEPSRGAAVALLRATDGARVWGPVEHGDAHGEATDLRVAPDGATLGISGHGGANGELSGRLTSVRVADGARAWTRSFSVGGDRRLIFNECWGLAVDAAANNFVLACGAGIEGCEAFEGARLQNCKKGRGDPRPGAVLRPPGVWQSLTVGADVQTGALRWQRVDSYKAADDPALGAPDWEAGTSAAEWVFATRDGGVAVVEDEGFGVGLMKLAPSAADTGAGAPTPAPSAAPTVQPTETPTAAPSTFSAPPVEKDAPTGAPTGAPTRTPTSAADELDDKEEEGGEGGGGGTHDWVVPVFGSGGGVGLCAAAAFFAGWRRRRRRETTEKARAPTGLMDAGDPGTPLAQV